MEEAESRAREEKNIQQNHANAPPTWVQHTLEIEDDQDKGSQASGQHHPANSVHPHHFQQRRLHGFVLAAETRLSGRRVRSAEAGTPPRGTSAREVQNGAGRAPELDPARFTEALRAPSPGLWARGVQGAGVAVQVWRCVAPAARSCRSASPQLDAPPPRLCWRLRPPLPPHGPGDRDARRKVPPPPCTGLCDCPGPPPSLSRQKLLHCAPVIYIFQGWVLPNATRSPRRGEGAGELGGRGRAGAERRLPPPLPETWSRPAVSPGVRRAQRAPAGSQKPSVPGRSWAAESRLCVNVSMTKPGAGKNKNKISLVLPPILPCGKTGSEKQVRLGGFGEWGLRGGTRRFKIPWAI